MKILKKLTYAQWAVLLLALLTVIIPIMINYATATPPRWVKEYPWLPWAILAVLTLIFVVVSYLQSRERHSEQRQVDSYTVGSPIKEPSYFFGRSAQVEEFFTNLNTAQPQSLQVLGLRRAGKTPTGKSRTSRPGPHPPQPPSPNTKGGGSPQGEATSCPSACSSPPSLSIGGGGLGGWGPSSGCVTFSAWRKNFVFALCVSS